MEQKAINVFSTQANVDSFICDTINETFENQLLRIDLFKNILLNREFLDNVQFILFNAKDCKNIPLVSKTEYLHSLSELLSTLELSKEMILNYSKLITDLEKETKLIFKELKKDL